MYLYDYENGIGYAGFEKTSIFSMNQKKGSDSRLYCKMEPNRGGRFFNAARRIGGQPVPFAGVKSSDRFDEADRSDGEQILRVFVEVLVFFDHMGYKAQISFNQDVFCFEISFCIFLDIVFFFRRRQRRRK